MCLWIESDPEKNREDLEEFVGDRQEILVYKVLEENLKMPSSSNKCAYRSPYFHYSCWDFEAQTVYNVARHYEPTNDELNDGRIEIGLHVYTSLEEAKRQQKGLFEKVIQFKVFPDDIVAIENGLVNDLVNPNFKELVCTKLTFVKVMED